MDTQQTNQSSPSQLMLFVDKLIEKKNFPNLSPEIREQLKKDAVRELDTFMLTRILASLSDEERQTLLTMIQENQSQDVLRQFAMDHIPNYTALVTQFLQEFQQRYLE